MRAPVLQDLEIAGAEIGHLAPARVGHGRVDADEGNAGPEDCSVSNGGLLCGGRRGDAEGGGNRSRQGTDQGGVLA